MKVATKILFPSLSFKTIIYFLLLMAILLGFLLRTVGLTSANMLFLYDNGHDLLFVKKLVVDHKPLLVGSVSSSIEGYFHGVLWFYMLAIPFLLSKGNPVAFTLFMAICSTLSIVLAFFILKKIANLYAGLLGAIIFAFAAFSINTTKFIWNPYPIVWIMPLYFFALYLFTRNKTVAFPLMTFLTSLIIHFEAIYGICLLLPQAVVTILWISQKIPMKQKLSQGLLSIFLFLLPIVPSLIFDLRHHFLISSSLLKALTSGGSTISHPSHMQSTPFIQRIIQRGENLYEYSIGALSPTLFINFFLTGLAVFSIFKLKDKQDRLLSALSFITVVSPFFVFLSMKYYVWEHYWIGTAPFFAIIISYFIGKYIASPSFKKITIPFLLACIALMLSYTPWTTLSVWKQGVLNQGAQTLSTQNQVVDTVYAAAKNRPFSVYQETPPVYDFVYRYLFWWKGYSVYHRYPTNEKQPITFVIRETVPSDPEGTFFRNKTLHISDAPTKTISFPGGPILEEYEDISPQPSVDPNYFPQL